MKKKQHISFATSTLLTVLKAIPERSIILIKCSILFLGFFLMSSLDSYAQTYPNIHQPYQMIAENHDQMLEISIMVAQCTSSASDSVYVMIFNEKGVKDTANFDLICYKENKSDSTSISISYKMEIGEMAIPSCSNGTLRNLVFPLPSGYDPKKSTFAVKFK